MATLNDAKFDALRAQGFTGALSDMTLQWLQENIPKLDNLNVNPTYQGGADSGPIDGEFPPTGYILGFNTSESRPVGPDMWETNYNEISGRCFLNYDVGVNNPDLVEGVLYRYELEITNLSGSNYGAAFVTSAVVDVTVVDIQSSVSANSTVLCFIEFTVDDAQTFSLQLRMGSGTTSNTTTRMLLGPATFTTGVEITASTIPDAWHEVLLGQGAVEPFQRNDAWYDVLGGLGFQGQLNDRELAFWEAGGTFPP